jgi:hypothetical protein
VYFFVNVFARKNKLSLKSSISAPRLYLTFSFYTFQIFFVNDQSSVQNVSV